MAAWQVAQPKISGLYHLSCAGDACLSCQIPVEDLPSRPDGYEHWPACPNKLLRQRWWQAIVQLWNASRVSPIAGWTSGHASWIVRGVSELRAAVLDHETPKEQTGGPSSHGGLPTGRPGPRMSSRGSSKPGPRYRGPSPWG